MSLQITRSIFVLSAVLLLPALTSAQTQSFNVGQSFFGKNVTSELPAGVIDLSDNMFASDTYTCPLAMSGTKAAPVTALLCRPHLSGNKFSPVITEGDARLAGTKLAIPVIATNDTGRYLTSMVRPESHNLYFTSISGTSVATFSNQIAWRLRNYTTLEKVAAAGDNVTLKLVNGAAANVTLSAAGPIDSDPTGREFIYLEAAGSNVYGLFEIKAGNVFEALFQGRILMRDTPWGMGGFVFDDGGLVFRQAVSLYQIDPTTKGLSIIAQEGAPGQPFMPPSVNYANLDLTQFSRPTNDPTTLFFNWGSIQGQAVPPEFFSIWKDWAQSPFYSNALGTPQATTAAVLASGDRITVMGAAPRGPGTDDYDVNSKISVNWPFTALWNNRNGGWTKILRDTDLPDATLQTPKKFYQGVTAYNCQVEFATKRYDSSFDNSGSFYGLYRLARPCIDSATFNTVTRELIIKGVNLQDQRTEIGVPPTGTPLPGAPLGTLLAARVTSVSPIEVHATLDSITTLENVEVLINGVVWSDPVKVAVTTSPAPILADLVDLNFDGTPGSPSKLMTVTGVFGCATATTPSVAYPDTLGNCTVLLDNSIRLPMLYASNQQINFLLPPNLTAFAHDIRVTRQDANGTFASAAFITNTSPHSPVPIKTQNRDVIEVVIRNGQVVVLGPNDPIHPGEYFTFYLSGANISLLPSTVKLNDTEVPYAVAVVTWAQGVEQVNIQAPATPTGSVLVKLGDVPAFQVKIQ